MFGNLDDGPDLVIDAPEFHKSHDMHLHHYCMACGCSVHSPVAARPCVPKVTASPVTTQPVAPSERDDPDWWFKRMREFSA